MAFNAELIKCAERELLEYFGFPSEPKALTDLFTKAAWKTLVRSRAEIYQLQKQIKGIRDAIVTDQATGAADYPEAEAYADKIIKAATPENGSFNPENFTGTGLFLDEMSMDKGVAQ